MGNTDARDRLLTTASRIFYLRGIHTVPVDEVIGAAGVSRATFYRHFSGKEDLVRACLAAHADDMRARVSEIVAAAGSPRVALTVLVTGLGERLRDTSFRGCPFINAAAEFPDPTHPVRGIIAGHRAWLVEAMTALLTTAGRPDPAADARTLMMLRDGALVGGYLDDRSATLATLARAVDSFT
ncbi:TetR/AcrR family transcriptional regulator [Saccharothrix violaceirubra]|uniref:AcrR family transcriptional regulator n=1 Tax=Saccharothrix violaceirubra TaxID=413306 RepID=A0A7W7WWI2_9PSEU|nr:TetR/AcrR family transcriptional regulator [Saccharothrix violaceirubra]MBB4966017.1 AcrR family transcriptional regulator [Saccharothrix violaceirubra]